MKHNFSIIIICFIQLMCSSVILAQEDNLRYELFFANDNDSYVMRRSDRYYTNGLAAGLLMRLSKKPFASNSLEFNLQHRMYNGVAITKDKKRYWDRPFSAVLSFQTTFRHSFNAKRQIGLTLNMEQVGPKASGGELQNFFHEVFNIYEVNGWDSQLPNFFGVDLGLSYMEDVYSNRFFSLATTVDAVVGMNNTYFQAGVPIRLGKIKAINQSIFTKSNVNSDVLNDEFFVFYKPSLSYQVKNSSIHNWNLIDLQYPGNAVRNNILTQQIGVTFAKKKTALSFSLTRYTSEMKAMKYAHHSYGRIQLNRRF